MKIDELRDFLCVELKSRLALLGLEKPDLVHDLDLFSIGLIDSMGFTELITAIESHFDVEISLESIDPERLYTLEGICAHAQPKR